MADRRRFRAVPKVQMIFNCSSRMTTVRFSETLLEPAHILRIDADCVAIEILKCHSEDWQAICEAIATKKQKLSSLIVRNCPLDDLIMLNVGRLLNLKRLELTLTNITNHGVFALLELVGLQQLTISAQRGIDVTSLAAVVSALPNLTKLRMRIPDNTSISLEHQNLSLSRLHLITENAPNITSLNLSNNAITDSGADLISRGFPQLRHLDLSFNLVGVEGTVAISRRLRHLTQLMLGHCTLGVEGALAIARSLPNLKKTSLHQTLITSVGILAVALKVWHSRPYLINCTEMNDFTRQRLLSIMTALQKNLPMALFRRVADFLI